MPFPARTERFAELLRRMFVAKTGLSPTNVLDDVFPVLDLESSRPELLRGRGELAWHAGFAQTAPGIGNFAGIELTVAAGRLVVVEGIAVRAQNAGRFYVRQQAAAGLQSVVQAIPYSITDTRWGSPALGSAPHGFTLECGFYNGAPTNTQALLGHAEASPVVNRPFSGGAWVVHATKHLLVTYDTSNSQVDWLLWGYAREQLETDA